MKNATKYQRCRLWHVAALAIVLTGCNPGVFDELTDEMWVDSSGSPDGLDSSDYANGIVWGGNAASGVQIYAIGNRPAWAQLSYSDSGALSANALRVSTFLSAVDLLTGVPPVAADPDNISGDKGTVALGTSQNNAAFVVLLDAETFSFTTSISLTNGTELVDALAMGPTNAGGTGSDIVIMRERPSDSRISIVHEYQTQTGSPSFDQPSCLFPAQEGYAVVIAELDTVSADSEIIIGMGDRSRTSGTGQVLIIAGSLVTDAEALDPGNDSDCLSAGSALATIAAPNGESDFGAAIVVGDFDGDGANGGAGNDLAISAPSANKVYVYFDVDASTGIGTPLVIDPPPGAGRYGTALAVGRFDLDNTHELVIGDPEADVDAVFNSGRADIIVFSGEIVGTVYRLLDAEAENSQNFGRALTVATFKGSDILVVGARDEVFTYFRTPVRDDADGR